MQQIEQRNPVDLRYGGHVTRINIFIPNNNTLSIDIEDYFWPKKGTMVTPAPPTTTYYL